MGALTSPKTYVGLAVFHAVDAVLCAIPIPQVEELLEALQLSDRKPPMGWVLAAVKTAAAVGLGSVHRAPGLARLTTAMLTLYFTIAVGLHIREWRHGTPLTRLIGLTAVGFLAACAVMTVRGPDRPA
ncbi:hypothetical protein KIH27_10865 [Mycobacterium sp. M1]|uniref:DoxX family protein n=1 Tax=Mycolicibacter acidiphilus TaxID=2835306 RepID=A0ABS5RIG4_9MYCO|nr:hypothetical protein [Mycolicibacter acidiphilus]MBS9534085.1 hypothetical protein [Mycolicibacter acidiphilus]